RVDAFGEQANDNSSGTAIFASGLADPKGICPLPDGSIGVVDHRESGDVLIALRNGADYTTPDDKALWTYRSGNGGAVDCAVANGALLATSSDGEKVIRIAMTADGGFTGTPEALLQGEYGRLRTAVAGPGDLVWLTTANTGGQ